MDTYIFDLQHWHIKGKSHLKENILIMSPHEIKTKNLAKYK